MALQAIVLDELDRKVTEAFPGLVVRKDLLRVLRSAYGVPTFVIEFLLGKYCASADPEVIERGMEFVRRSLSSKFVKPDERVALLFTGVVRSSSSKREEPKDEEFPGARHPVAEGLRAG